MTPEEFNRIKEAEKEHLRKLKALRQALHTLRRQQSINHTLAEMTDSSEDVLQTHEEMVERLALETAQAEARLEIALEATEEEATEEADPAALENFTAEQRARDLLRQIKLEVQGPDVDRPPSPDAQTTDAGPATDSVQGKKSAEEPLPEKTIGRMRTS